MDKEFGSYHPWVNFIYFAVVIAITMFTLNPIWLLMSFVFASVYSIILGGLKSFRLQLLIALPVFVFMVLIHPLFYNNGETILFYINNSRVTLEAIFYGITTTLLFLTVVIWFRCFSIFITSDKLIYLFGRIVPNLALIVSMVFRFIPLLKSRYEEITYAQLGMKKSMNKESLPQKCRRVVKQISILIAWSLECSIETADSMEARGYGLKGRTSFHLFHFVKRDAVVLLIIILLTGFSMSGLITGRMTVFFYPTIVFQKADQWTYISSIGFFLLLLLPIEIEWEGVRRWKQFSSNI